MRILMCPPGAQQAGGEIRIHAQAVRAAALGMALTAEDIAVLQRRTELVIP